jgi:hypothetical protein
MITPDGAVPDPEISIRTIAGVPFWARNFPGGGLLLLFWRQPGDILATENDNVVRLLSLAINNRGKCHNKVYVVACASL